MSGRVHLSPPDVGDAERRLLLDAFDSGWIAPLGPHVDAFERELAAAVGVGHAAALSSGTAALHLALTLLGVGPGDDVLVSTLTFVATANVVRYVGATPVFVDCDAATWQMDPDLLSEELARRARAGRLPAAVIVVDLYGQCADYDRILPVCERYGVPVVEDAAEALGATYRGRAAGSLGALAAFSFNGNKVITTSGGGMLVSDRPDWIERARFLASQAREATVHYEHLAVGYNYRLSNLLSAVGRAQLATLEERVARRRRTNRLYRSSLEGLPGITFMPEADYGTSSCWLTCLLVDPDTFGATSTDVRLRLDRLDIEARPVWKPMHLQPLYRDCASVGGAVADGLFERGLCLPSGSSLTDDDRQRIIDAVAGCQGRTLDRASSTGPRTAQRVRA